MGATQLSAMLRHQRTCTKVHRRVNSSLHSSLASTVCRVLRNDNAAIRLEVDSCVRSLCVSMVLVGNSSVAFSVSANSVVAESSSEERESSSMWRPDSGRAIQSCMCSSTVAKGSSFSISLLPKSIRRRQGADIFRYLTGSTS